MVRFVSTVEETGLKRLHPTSHPYQGPMMRKPHHQVSSSDLGWRFTIRQLVFQRVLCIRIFLLHHRR